MPEFKSMTSIPSTPAATYARRPAIAIWVRSEGSASGYRQAFHASVTHRCEATTRTAAADNATSTIDALRTPFPSLRLDTGSDDETRPIPELFHGGAM